jgi:hypothetical protein
LTRGDAHHQSVDPRDAGYQLVLAMVLALYVDISRLRQPVRPVRPKPIPDAVLAESRICDPENRKATICDDPHLFWYP